MTSEVRSRFVDLWGERGHLLESGAGVPVVIIASLLVRASSYLPLLRALSGNYHVMVLALPGAGHTREPREPLSQERLIALTAEFLQGVAEGPALVIGHSNSGAVAMGLAVHHPSLVRGLVLADSVGARQPVNFWGVLFGRLVDALLEPWLALTRGWHLIASALLHAPTFWKQVFFSCRVKLLALAAEVKVPTLIAWGRWDHTFPLHCAERLQRAIPHARVVTGPGSHDWLITRPRAFAKAVREFDDSLPS